MKTDEDPRCTVEYNEEVLVDRSWYTVPVTPGITDIQYTTNATTSVGGYAGTITATTPSGLIQLGTWKTN